MAYRNYVQLPVGPPPKQGSIKLISYVVEQLQNCYVPDVRSSLSDIQRAILPYASALDEHTLAYNNFRGTHQHQEAKQIRDRLIDTDIDIATTLIFQIEAVLAYCEHLLEFYQRESDSARRTVMIDQARADKERIRNVHGWLEETYRKGQTRHSERSTKRLEAPQSILNMKVPKVKNLVLRKRHRSESEYSPDSSPYRALKKPRRADPSKDAPIVVLDLCSDGEQEPIIIQSNQAASRPIISHAGRFVRPNVLVPSTRTNLPPRRPHRKDKLICHIAAETHSAEALKPALQPTTHTTLENVKLFGRQSRGVPSDLASTILRAVGRHPTLPALNHNLERLLSRLELQKHSRQKTVENRAELQDRMVKDLASWWKAQ